MFGVFSGNNSAKFRSDYTLKPSLKDAGTENLANIFFFLFQPSVVEFTEN